MKKYTCNIDNIVYDWLNEITERSNKKIINIERKNKLYNNDFVLYSVIFKRDLLIMAKKYDPFNNEGLFTTPINIDEWSEEDKEKALKMLEWFINK